MKAIRPGFEVSRESCVACIRYAPIRPRSARSDRSGPAMTEIPAASLKKAIVVDVLIAQLPKHSAAQVRVWRCGGWRIDRVDGAPRSEQPRSSPRGSARCRDRRSRSSPDEMTLATATGSVPRPRSFARPPPARRRPTRRARRERPVRGSARASGRRSSRCRTAGPAPLRVRDSPPSSPRRPGPHPTTRGARVQGELSVFICVRFLATCSRDSLRVCGNG